MDFLLWDVVSIAATASCILTLLSATISPLFFSRFNQHAKDSLYTKNFVAFHWLYAIVLSFVAIETTYGVASAVVVVCFLVRCIRSKLLWPILFAPGLIEFIGWLIEWMNETYTYTYLISSIFVFIFIFIIIIIITIVIKWK